MFLIVFAHYLSSDNWAVSIDPAFSSSLAYACHISLIMTGQVGVCIFLLISGYFLASTTRINPINRLCKVVIETDCYSIPILILFYILYRFGFFSNWGSVFNCNTVLNCLFPITRYTYWFMSTYFALLVFSPIIIIFFRKYPSASVVFLIAYFFIFYVWKVLNPTLNFPTDFTYQLFVFSIGCFLGVNKYRFNGFFVRFSSLKYLIVLMLSSFCGFIATAILVKFNSELSVFGYQPFLFISGVGSVPIFAIVDAICLFLLTLSSSKGSTDNTAVDYLAKFSPAVLGVYLIHTNPIISPILWNFVFHFEEPNGFLLKVILSISSCVVLFILLLLISFFWYNVCVKKIYSILGRPINWLSVRIDMLIKVNRF